MQEDKAVCLHYGQDFPKTHSIVRLLDLLQSAGLDVPDKVKEADTLTQYAVQTRYPGPIEEITLEEYREALASAAHVVFWAETIISQGN